MYPKDYKGTASIMLEDYVAMEVLMKQLMLLAPAVEEVLFEHGGPAVYKGFLRLTTKVTNHLES